MYQGCAAPDGCNDVDRLRHFLQVGALLETSLGESINAVRALNGMSDRKRDQRFLPLGESAFGKYRIVLVKELL